jgi:hypothetical protein
LWRWPVRKAFPSPSTLRKPGRTNPKPSSMSWSSASPKRCPSG